MGFLKRVTGGGGSPPPWCQHLTSSQYASFRGDVRSVLDRDLSSDAELADATHAEGYYRLITLARLAGQRPDEVWSTFVRDDLAKSRERKTLGDDIEARSRTLDAAVPSLRLALYRSEWVPSGDVSVPSVLAGFVDALVLDAGPSVRNVPDRLAAGWAADIETVVDLARDQVRRLPVERATREHAGHPLVRSVSIEAQGPYVGVLLQDLPEIVPDAIGTLGTLVGVPASGGFFYVALESTPSLRQDLLDLALIHSMVESKTARPLAKLPMWRRLDGSFVEVPLKLDEHEGVIGSYHPGFEGVLTTLDPLTFLPVAPWAQGTLSVQQYTRFAGLVSVARNVRPDEVTMLGSAWALADLAVRCRGIDVDEWPSTIATYTAAMRADLASAQAIVDAWGTAPAAVHDHLAVYLAVDAAVEPDMTARPSVVPGVSEVLCVYAADATAQLPPDAAAAMGPIGDLFVTGESAVRAAIEVQPMADRLLTASLVGIRSRPAASGILPHLLDWVPEAAGPGGALVSIARSELMVALPVTDRGFVLDLPEFIGLAFGMYEAAEWPGTHAVYWVRPDGISAIDAQVGPTGRVIGRWNFRKAPSPPASAGDSVSKTPRDSWPSSVRPSSTGWRRGRHRWS